MKECGLSLKQIKGLILYCKTPSCQALNKKNPNIETSQLMSGPKVIIPNTSQHPSLC
jgi:hypothetical protein